MSGLLDIENVKWLFPHCLVTHNPFALNGTAGPGNLESKSETRRLHLVSGYQPDLDQAGIGENMDFKHIKHLHGVPYGLHGN